MRLVAAYGATEVGAITHMVPHDEDVREWLWFRVSDAVKVRWAAQGDGTSECQILVRVLLHSFTRCRPLKTTDGGYARAVGGEFGGREGVCDVRPVCEPPAEEASVEIVRRQTICRSRLRGSAECID